MNKIWAVVLGSVALLSVGCLTQGVAQELGRECALEWQDEGLCLATEWIEKPSANKKGGDLLVKFWRPKTGGTAEGPYVSPSGAIPVELFMPEHGHGSDVDPVAHPQLDEQGAAIAGVYNVKPIHFIMRGNWEVRIGGAVMKYRY